MFPNLCTPLTTVGNQEGYHDNDFPVLIFQLGSMVAQQDIAILKREADTMTRIRPHVNVVQVTTLPSVPNLSQVLGSYYHPRALYCNRIYGRRFFICFSQKQFDNQT